MNAADTATGNAPQHAHQNPAPASGRRLSVAPMMDWTEEGVSIEGRSSLL
jgi:hypothetical protein